MAWNASSADVRIAVLAGGDSAEREISLASGAYAAGALQAAGFNVARFDPAHTPVDQIDWRRFDACFLALHGGSGEDGRVQAQLDRVGVPYTGSGPAACRLAMSKSASKERFLQSGVRTPPYLLFHASDDIERIVARAAEIGFPLIIKPDSQGSSLGVGLVSTIEAVAENVQEARKFDPFMIAERFIAGREFTVAVLDREPLPLLEIIAGGTLFDYGAKYLAASTEYRLDPELPRGVACDLVDAAVRAAESLGTRGLVRVDLRLGRSNCPWVLEVNTSPGLTDHSLAPKAALHAGIDMPGLCQWMVNQCLQQASVR